MSIYMNSGGKQNNNCNFNYIFKKLLYYINMFSSFVDTVEVADPIQMSSWEVGAGGGYRS